MFRHVPDTPRNILDNLFYGYDRIWALHCLSKPFVPFGPIQNKTLILHRALNLGGRELEIQGTCTLCNRAFCWSHVGNHLQKGAFQPPIKKRRSNV